MSTPYDKYKNPDPRCEYQFAPTPTDYCWSYAHHVDGTPGFEDMGRICRGCHDWKGPRRAKFLGKCKWVQRKNRLERLRLNKLDIRQIQYLKDQGLIETLSIEEAQKLAEILLGSKAIVRIDKYRPNPLGRNFIGLNEDGLFSVLGIGRIWEEAFTMLLESHRELCFQTKLSEYDWNILNKLIKDSLHLINL